MSTYKQIAGTTVKAYTTNPSDPQEGEMWYNQTTLKLRGVTALGAWSSAAPLSTGRYLGGSFGTPTAGVISTGSTPAPTDVTDTEEYNGSGWTSGTAYPTAGDNFGGAGTQTAGLAAGGLYPTRVATSNTYNGTSWTATGSLPGAADNIAFCGNVRTDAIGAVGRTPSTGNTGNNTTVVYDGSSFSSGPNINTSRMFGVSSGSGTGTAGLIFGGFIDPSPNAMNNTEEYDGSSWTAGGVLNTASSFCSGFGIQTDTIAQVNSPNYAGTEQYNGTSWTALPDMGVTSPGGLYGSKAFSPSGTSSGYITSLSPTADKTEEWNFSAQVVTAGAWASAPSMNTGRTELMGVKEGTQTAALACGGQPGTTPPIGLNNSEEYNGSSWTEGNNLNTARKRGSSNGTQTAGLTAGGTDSSPVASGVKNESEEYDGTSWSEGNNLNTARLGLGGSAGPQTASIVAGGYNSSGDKETATEEYNGTSWTAGTALPTATNDAGGAGTSTAMIFGGGNAPPGNVNTVFSYDGSSWTSSPTTLTYSVRLMASSGSSTSAIFSGGEAPSDVATVNIYDGTVFATAPTLGTARGRLSGAGTTTAAIVYGGDPVSSATEEFTGETTAANTVDITTAE